jgi:hypothetical protein
MQLPLAETGEAPAGFYISAPADIVRPHLATWKAESSRFYSTRRQNRSRRSPSSPSSRPPFPGWPGWPGRYPEPCRCLGLSSGSGQSLNIARKLPKAAKSISRPIPLAALAGDGIVSKRNGRQRNFPCNRYATAREIGPQLP